MRKIEHTRQSDIYMDSTNLSKFSFEKVAICMKLLLPILYLPQSPHKIDTRCTHVQNRYAVAKHESHFTISKLQPELGNVHLTSNPKAA